MLSVSNKAQILDSIKIDKPKIIQKLLETNTKIVFVTAHFGNWEYTTPAFSCYFNHKITAVARMTPYPLINEYLIKVRSKFNITILDKRGAAIPLAKALKKDGVVGIVTDQNTTSKEGELVDFFGKKCVIHPLPHSLQENLMQKSFILLLIILKITERFSLKFYPPLNFKRQMMHKAIFTISLKFKAIF